MFAWLSQHRCGVQACARSFPSGLESRGSFLVASADLDLLESKKTGCQNKNKNKNKINKHRKQNYKWNSRNYALRTTIPPDHSEPLHRDAESVLLIPAITHRDMEPSCILAVPLHDNIAIPASRKLQICCARFFASGPTWVLKRRILYAKGKPLLDSDQ